MKSEKRMKNIGAAALWALPMLAQYQEVKLFQLPGANTSAGMACAVNNNGTVAGVASLGGVQRAYVMKNGEFELLPPLPGYDVAIMTDINDAGTVLGLSAQSGNAALTFTGTIWRDGVPSPLPVPAPSQAGSIIQFRPYAMNNSETMVGQTVEYLGGVLGNQIVKAVVLSGSTFTEIPSPAVSGPIPIDINNPGDILVSVLHDPANGFVGPGFFLLSGGSYTRVDVPAGTFNLRGLNDQREFLGFLESGPWFLLRHDGVLTIPDLLGSVYTEYYRLNNKRETCGTARSYSPQGVIEFYQAQRRLR